MAGQQEFDFDDSNLSSIYQDVIATLPSIIHSEKFHFKRPGSDIEQGFDCKNFKASAHLSNHRSYSQQTQERANVPFAFVRNSNPNRLLAIRFPSRQGRWKASEVKLGQPVSVLAPDRNQISLFDAVAHNMVSGCTHGDWCRFAKCTPSETIAVQFLRIVGATILQSSKEPI